MLDYCLGLRITNRDSSIISYESEVSRTMKPLEPSSLQAFVSTLLFQRALVKEASVREVEDIADIVILTGSA